MQVSFDAFNEKWQEQIKTGNPNLRKALLATYGRSMIVSGMFKLLWSVCVIMGAFFFVRTLQFVSTTTPACLARHSQRSHLAVQSTPGQP